MLADDEETIEDRLGDSQDLALKKHLLAEALKTLNEREQAILKKRYLSENPQTLEDLGAEFHISRERVRQIETKAFEKVKKSIQAHAEKLAII